MRFRPSRSGTIAVAAIVLAGAATAVVVATKGSSGRADATREQAMIKNLASQDITFTPARSVDRAARRSSAASVEPSAVREVPPQVRRDAAVYLGRLREVRGLTLGPHGAWAVVQRGDSPFHASAPVDRLAYVVQLRNVPECRVEISCPMVPGSPSPGKFEEYDSFVDARTGLAIGGLGLPEGYDPNHPFGRRHARG